MNVVNAAMPTLPPILRVMFMIDEALLFCSDGTPLYAAVLIRNELEEYERLIVSRPGNGRVVDVGIELGHVKDCCPSDDKPRRDQPSHVQLAGQCAYHGHHQHERKPTRRENEPRIGCGIAEQQLHKEWQQHGAAEQHEP